MKKMALQLPALPCSNFSERSQKTIVLLLLPSTFPEICWLSSSLIKKMCSLFSSLKKSICPFFSPLHFLPIKCYHQLILLPPCMIPLSKKINNQWFWYSCLKWFSSPEELVSCNLAYFLPSVKGLRLYFQQLYTLVNELLSFTFFFFTF